MEEAVEQRRLAEQGLPGQGAGDRHQGGGSLRLAAAQGLPVQYGDSEDTEFTASLPLSSATVVVSTLPSLRSNAAIRHGLESAGFQGHVMATAHDEAEVVKLESIGAHRTLLPFLDAAERAAELIEDDLRELRQ